MRTRGWCVGDLDCNRVLRVYVVHTASLERTTVSDDSHIYADPTAYVDVLSQSAGAASIPRLDPAHITIDTVTSTGRLWVFFYVQLVTTGQFH